MSTVAYTSLEKQPSLIDAMKDLEKTTQLLSRAQAIRDKKSVLVSGYAPAPYQDVLRRVGQVLKNHHLFTDKLSDLSAWQEQKKKPHPLIKNVLKLSNKFGLRYSFLGTLQTCFSCKTCQITTPCKEEYILDYWASKFNFQYPVVDDAPSIEEMS
jgi:hypothetical protein